MIYASHRKLYAKIAVLKIAILLDFTLAKDANSQKAE